MKHKYWLASSRQIVSLLSACILVSGLALTMTATPANAAACTFSGCAGHDPYVYGCSATSEVKAYYYTPSPHPALMVTLINYYSYSCKANWSWAQLSPYAVSLGWNFKEEINTYDGGNQLMCYPGENNTGSWFECGVQGTYGGSSPAWTDMVSGRHIAYADVELYDAYGNNIVEFFANQ